MISTRDKRSHLLWIFLKISEWGVEEARLRRRQLCYFGAARSWGGGLFAPISYNAESGKKWWDFRVAYIK